MRGWMFVALVLVLMGPLRADERKNVIVLFVDDWGWTDAACLGSDLYETPHIDAFAASAVRFTDGYSACTVCSPSRAALLTGLYPARTRVTDWIPGHDASRNPRQRARVPLLVPDWTQKLEHRHTTLAESLKAAGYHTAHIGKWHLTPRSDDPQVVSEYYPERHGFDINIAGNQWGAPGSYFWPYKGRGEGLRQRVANFPEGGQEGDYLDEMLTDHAEKLIEQWKDEPFLIYMPYYLVHTPIQGKPELVKKYQQKIAQHEGPLRHKNPGYAAMVETLDGSVGRILAKLEALGLDEKTVVVLTSDNGGLSVFNGPTHNHPLRAGKGSAYEGGTRVPFMIRAPGVTQPGGVCAEPVIGVDILPTILSLTGTTEHGPQVELDGLDLTPVLRDPMAQLDRETLFWHYPHYHPGGAEPYSAIRARDWLLVQFHHDMRVELYNLRDDLGQTRDLSETEASIRDRLAAQLNTWRKDVDAQMPTPNPDYQPDAATN